MEIEVGEGIEGGIGEGGSVCLGEYPSFLSAGGGRVLAIYTILQHSSLSTQPPKFFTYPSWIVSRYNPISPILSFAEIDASKKTIPYTLLRLPKTTSSSKANVREEWVEVV